MPEQPSVTLPALIRGSGTALHPEGVGWDPSRGAFLVGSLRYGSVSVVEPDGRAWPLVHDDRLIATGGLRADVARNRLLVTFDDVYAGPGGLLSEGSTEQTAGRHAGLGIFRLDDGKPVHLVDLGRLPGLHLANDLAIDDTGTAYVTDSFSPSIFRVTPDGEASVFVQDDAFDAPITDGLPEVGLNGIVHHPDGYLLTVRYDTGTLLRVPLEGSPEPVEVELDRPPVGADGIALRADGDLVVATNTIRSTGIDGVFLLRSKDGWRSAETVRSTPWPDPSPTTIAVTPYGDYVLSSNLLVLFRSGGKDTTDGFTLRRH